MTDKKVELTRRKALGGLATIGAASAAAGAGTFAMYSDSETQTGDTVSLGTVDLEETSSITLSQSGSGSDASFDASTTVQYTGSLSADLHVWIEISEGDDTTSPTESNDDADNADMSPEAFAKAMTLDQGTDNNYIKVGAEGTDDNGDPTGNISSAAPEDHFDGSANSNSWDYTNDISSQDTVLGLTNALESYDDSDDGSSYVSVSQGDMIQFDLAASLGNSSHFPFTYDSTQYNLDDTQGENLQVTVKFKAVEQQ